MHGAVSNSLIDSLRQACASERGVLFALAGGQRKRLAYSRLWALARRRLAALRANGIQAGDHALIVTDDLEAFVVQFWACLLGGIVAVPVAVPGNREVALKVSRIAETLGRPWLLAEPGASARLCALAEDLGTEAQAPLVALERRTLPAEVPENAGEADADAEIVAAGPEDIAFIQFSSGSTGHPKGVTLTHGNLLRNLRGIAAYLDPDGTAPEDRLLSWMPLTHDFGLIWFHLLPVVGGLDHCLLPTRMFIRNGLSWPQWASDFGATLLGAPNFAFRHVLKTFDPAAGYGWDLSAVRMIANAAEPIIPPLADEFLRTLAPYGLRATAMTSGYGLAEATLVVTLAPADTVMTVVEVDRLSLSPGDRVGAADKARESDRIAFVDVGAPIAETEVRIADDAGGWCDEAVVGLIKVRGPGVMRGYVNNPEATSATVDADGWLDTGDLGFLRQGHLVITGRRKDVIIINGVNYYPQDIERVVAECDGLDLNMVLACAVPHPDGEREALAIFVQFRKATEAFAPVAAQVRDRVVREVGIPVDFCLPVLRIPKTTSGKLQRFEMVKRFKAGAFDESITVLKQVMAEDGAAMRQAWRARDRRGLLDALLAEAARLGPGEAPADDKPLMESGFTSLRLVELHDRLNRALGLELPITVMFECPTPSALVDALLKTGAGVIESASPAATEPTAFGVAVVGLGLRLPGGINDLEALGAALEQGLDAIDPIPAERGWPESVEALVTTTRAGWLDDLSAFDARLFRISPVEAEAMDPQQRLLLTASWEAFEDAGIDTSSLKGSRTGVFVGVGPADYVQAQARTGDLADVGPYSFTGSSPSVAAGRLSFFYGLRGPCVATDTACSSGLVALQQALRALRAGDCDTALVCGVNVILSPEMTVALSRMKALSPQARCGSFDDSADGYVRGEGCVALVLTGREAAAAGGHRVHAVLRGGAVNHDGASNGLIAPNGAAQADLLRAALVDAGVAPETVDYVEAHGTGTPLGDPVEAMALAQVFGIGRSSGRPLLIGSVKSNLGHLESASGLAGVAKVIAAFARGRLPASLHVATPNRRIPWDDIPLRLVDREIPWPEARGRPWRAGVSSFGMSGTNAHVVLEAPAPAPVPEGPRATPSVVLPVSALSAEALGAVAGRWADAVESCRAGGLADLAYTAAVGRARLPFRAAVTGDDPAALARQLRTVAGEGREQVERPPRLIFAFPGQGAQLPGMGRELCERWPVFRNSLLEAERLLAGHLERPLTELMWCLDRSALAATAVAQPVAVAFGLALADLLRDWGIVPSGALGHSVGEITAAAVAGALDRGDALRFAAERGRLMQGLPVGGAMAAVAAPLSRVRYAIEPARGRVVIAAYNGPETMTLSGAADALDGVLAALTADGFRCTRLDVSHAFHSPLMDPVLEPLARIATGLRGSDDPLPVYSTLTGRAAETGCHRTADFWVRQAREPVRFADALLAVPADGPKVVLELGGRPVLAPLAAAAVPELNWLAAHAARNPVQGLFTMLGRLFEAGAEIDWPRVFDGQPVRRVRGPTYPFSGHVRVLPTVRGSRPSVMQAEAGAVASAVAVPSPDGDRRERIAADIRGILKGIAGLAPSDVGSGVNWFSLGLDSLLIVQMQQGLTRIYGTAPTLGEIYESGDTLEHLTALLDSRLPADPALVTMPQAATKGSALEAVMARQIEAMSNLFNQQLEVLRGKPPAAVPAAARRPEVSERPPVEIKGLFKRTPGKSDNWTPAREAHVRKLAAAWNARSAGSKAMAADGRSVYANSRSVLGFRPEWKELIYPLHVARAEGAHVWDVDGNRYVDITMGFGATLLGHMPPFVRRAVEAELASGAPLGAQTPRAATVARLIAEMTGVERCAFFSTGSEAVMVAVRLARAVTRRSRIVMFVNSYHGNFDGVLAAGWADGGKTVTMPVTDGTPQGMIDDVIVLRYGDPEALAVIRAHADSLAAVLVEPVQSRDPAVQPKEFLKELRTLTAERDVALIFDEMILGFRIHPAGAQRHFGIEADIVTYGKVVGGGLPIGVVAGKARFLDTVDGGAWRYGDDSVPAARTAFVAGTFNSHPLTMAAAEAVLRHLREQGPALQEAVNARTANLCARLATLFESERVPIRMVHFGSLFRFEFSGDTEILNYHLLNNGVFVWEGRNCFLSTEHSDADLDLIVEAAARGIRAMREDGWLPPAPGGGVPLWRGQKEMLALAAGHPEVMPAFTESVALDLSGPLDAKALGGALIAVQRRHEALRAHRIDGKTWEAAPDALAALVLEAVADDDGAVDHRMRAALAQPFDLQRGPLLRALLLRRNESRHVLVLLVHHLVADGWSLGLIVDDLAAHYCAAVSGVPVVAGEPTPYRAFSEWLAKVPAPGGSAEATGSPPLALPRAGGMGEGFVGARVARLDPALGQGTLFEAVKAAARRLGVSPVAVLFAGYAVLLGRLANQTRFTVGLPVAGHVEAGLPHMAGYASVIAPLAVELDPAEPFAGLARRLQDRLVAVQRGIGSLLGGDSAGAPVNALFNVDRGLRLDLPGLCVAWVPAPVERVSLDIFLNVMEVNGAAWFELDCAASVADADGQARWMDSLVAILSAAVSGTEAAVRDLPLSAADRAAAAANTGIRVVDAFGRSAAIGTPGIVERRQGDAWNASGDLGRLTREQMVEVLGPADQVVPLGGRLVDLRRVEAALASLPDVEAVVALMEEGGVTAFVAARRPGLAVDRLAAAALMLPAVERPLRYALVEALPRGADGNVDRVAVAALAAPRESGRMRVVPRTAEEARLAAIWGSVLGMADVGVTDSFFDLGGHSLKALRILGRVEAEFGRSPSLQEFFREPTVAGLAATLRATETRAPIPALPPAMDHPASHAQARLWMLEQLTPGLAAYNIAFALITGARLDEAVLRRALARLAARHENLRTVFAERDGMPRLVVLPDGPAPLETVAVSDEKAALAAADAVAAEPFELAETPPWRARLLRWPSGNRLVMVIHHVISDVWSIGVLVRDLLAIHAEESGGPRADLPVLKNQYRDYAAWDAARQDEADLGWWRTALADLPPPLDLPAAGPRPVARAHAGGRIHFSLPAASAASLRALAAGAGVSGFTVLVATVFAWLYRLTGRTDMVIGDAYAGRDHPDLADQIGLFVNVVPLRMRVEAGESFGALLRRTGIAVMDTLEHAATPLDRIIEAVGAPRDPSRNPLFDVVLVMDDREDIEALVDGTGFEVVELPTPTSQFDLTLYVTGRPAGMDFVAVYDAGLFERESAERMMDALRSVLESIAGAPDATVDGVPETAVSAHQERLWFVDRFERGVLYAGSPTYYTLPVVVRLDSAPAPDRLRAALAVLAERHDMARSAVATVADEPILVTRPSVTLGLIEVEGGFEDVLDVALAPFDPSEPPLIRAVLARQPGEAGALFALGAHQMAADKRSLYRMMAELATLYGGGHLPPAPDFRRTVILPERRAARGHAADAQWWRATLCGCAALVLPTDRPRPAIHTFTLGRAEASVTARTMDGLAGLGASREVLRAAFQVLMRRLSGQSDIIIGEPLEPNRDTAVGPATNLLPLRLDIPATTPFAELVRKSRTGFVAAVEHGDMPFDLIVLAVKPRNDMSRTALFDVLFHYDDSPDPPGGRLVETGIGWGKYDLVLTARPAEEGLLVTLAYNRDLFDAENGALIVRRFVRLLDAAAVRPDAPLAELDIMDAEERRALAARALATAAYPRELTIHAAFERIVATRGDAPAITDGSRALSYAVVNTMANRLAHRLRAIGIRPDDRVGVLMARSAEVPIAFLGILKAGGAYVPIDADYPADRARFMAEDSGLRAVIADRARAEAAATLAPVVVTTDAFEDGPGDNPPPAAEPHHLAYVIYTSGSTGLPKGVMIEHRNVVQLMFHEGLPFRFSVDDVWALFHSTSFDFSVWEMYGALLYGGRLVVVPRAVGRDTAAWLELASREGITVINQTPTAFYAFAEAALARPDLPLAARLVIFGGEALLPARLADWRAANPQTRLVNMYGITETTVHVTFTEIAEAEIADGRSVIGRPLPSYGVVLLDETLALSPTGVEGEIAVTGPGVARGYLNRAELTADRFIVHPELPGARLYRSGDLGRLTPDGRLIYAGRMDSQVKVRGFRVELGEVESQLARVPGVDAAVVVAEPEGEGLTAYLVASVVLCRETVTRALAERLPDHMIPSRFLRVEAIPMTANGKADRNRLIAVGGTPLPAAAPVDAGDGGTELQRQVAAIWRDVLRIPVVNPRDNFFELGGHSLKANQVVARIRKILGKTLSLKDFFSAPTLEGLCDVIAVRETADVPPAIAARTPAGRDEGFPLSYPQRRLWLLQIRHPDAVNYNMVGGLRLKGAVDEVALSAAIKALVARHEVLRTTFAVRHGEPRQIIHAAPDASSLVIEDVTPAEDGDAVVRATLATEFAHVFDLEQGPLLRVRLIRLPSREAEANAALLFCLHHIIADGWSVAVMLRDIEALYRAARGEGGEPEPLALQYRDHVAWTAARVAAGGMEPVRRYWLRCFEDGVPVLDIPTDRPRPDPPSGRGAIAHRVVDETCSQRLRTFATRHGATLFMVLAALAQTQLHLRGGQRDIVLGTPVAGRQTIELESQVGFHLNLLPLRARLDGAASFAALLDSTRTTVLEAFDHACLPFDLLVEDLAVPPVPGRHPLFDVLLILQNNEPLRLDLPGVAAQPLRDETVSAKYDLNYMVEDKPALELSLEYALDLFDVATAEAMADEFVALAQAVADDPAITLAALRARFAPVSAPVLAIAGASLGAEDW